MGQRGRPAAAVRAVSALAAALTAVVGSVALAGCQSVAAGTTHTAVHAGMAAPTSAAGRVPLAVPVELRRVLREYPCGTATNTTTPGATTTLAPPSASTSRDVRDLDGADCFDLTPPLLTVRRLQSIAVASDSADDDWVINLTLTRQDATVLAGLNTGQELAVVVRGTVLATPTVAGDSTEVQISDNFSQADAQRVMRQITG
jgi:hypothetical protein